MCISALYNWFVLSTSYQHVEVSLGKVLMCWSAPCMAAAVFSVWMNYCKCMFWSPQTWLEIVPQSPYYKTVVSHLQVLKSSLEMWSPAWPSCLTPPPTSPAPDLYIDKCQRISGLYKSVLFFYSGDLAI